MTEKEPTLEEMAEQIEMTEKQLSDMKKAYHEKKYAGIKRIDNVYSLWYKNW
jgi:hypothetical protein